MALMMAWGRKFALYNLKALIRGKLFDLDAKEIRENLYDLPPAELAKIPTVAGSLREALDALDKDRAFLKAGGVMNDDMIDAYIELRMAENMRYEMTPHPVEYDMYYSV